MNKTAESGVGGNKYGISPEELETVCYATQQTRAPLRGKVTPEVIAHTI